MSRAAIETLETLARRLPFHLDDTKAVNSLYVRWREYGREQDRLLIELWTYCFIRRYYLIKFSQGPTHNAADLDVLIEATFEKVERFGEKVQHPTRFANWVSVICKNTYLNYLRRRKPSISIVDAGTPPLVAEPAMGYSDSGHARVVLNRAIKRLPDYLQECAVLRLLEGLTYEEIGKRTGQPLPRIRAYVNKALKRFREDEELLEYLIEEE